MKILLNPDKDEKSKNFTSNNNSNNNDYEGVSIQSSFLFDNSQNSIEDYYKNNFPNFKLFKFHNILICKMGKMLAFNFDKKTYIPKFCIGPHWYLTITLNFVVLIFEIILYISIVRKIATILIIIFILFSILILIIINRTALINPGIVLNKIKGKNDYGYCSICNVYYNPYDQVEHCGFCGVCIDKRDHHCVWIGKCVGRKNILSFYMMIAFTAIFYLYIIICTLIFYVDKKKK